MDDQLKQSALDFHEFPVPGKIQVSPTKPLATQRDLALAYSPGVAAPCLEIEKDPLAAYKYTARGNLVAVISNGTAVLGLGNIGALAGKPVMEGKGVLFKKFAGIDVFDIEVDELDPDKFINVVAALEPTFGGINLEDIKAPECFYIEQKLRERMNIPVFHDDQHGTAIISTAAILNGLRVVEKNLSDVRMVVSGAGAAAIACMNLLVALGMQKHNIVVCDSKGVIYKDREPNMAETKAAYAVEDDGKRERGSSGGGGRFGYDWFLGDVDGEARADAWAKEAVRMALVNLSAVAAPAGTLPVVLGAGWPGVLLHEAVGHGLEGDFNRRGTSVFSGQMGQLVSSELCTVVDDGTMLDRRGSISIDDEGTPGQYNVLIENGVLKGYMQDKLNARLMGVAPTGNGRRESYAHLPMPRMTNTYMLPGKSTPQEIIESVDYGIFAPNFGGGQVDITSGKFVFSTSEAYLIEKGKVTKAVKGATLIGSGIEAMQQISMVGNDLKLDNGVGVCGKEGQSLPVGVGQPTLKVDNLTVGGTA